MQLRYSIPSTSTKNIVQSHDLYKTDINSEYLLPDQLIMLQFIACPNNPDNFDKSTYRYNSLDLTKNVLRTSLYLLVFSYPVWPTEFNKLLDIFLAWSSQP